jgi:hypothetical protein
MATSAKHLDTIVVTKPVVIRSGVIEPVKHRYKVALIGFLILCLVILAVAMWIGSPK